MPQKTASKGQIYAIISLIIGSLSIVFCWVLGLTNIVSILLCMFGVFLSVTAKKELATTGGPESLAMVALIVCIVGFTLSVLVLVACVLINDVVGNAGRIIGGTIG